MIQRQRKAKLGLLLHLRRKSWLVWLEYSGERDCHEQHDGRSALDRR